MNCLRKLPKKKSYVTLCPAMSMLASLSWELRWKQAYRVSFDTEAHSYGGHVYTAVDLPRFAHNCSRSYYMSYSEQIAVALEVHELGSTDRMQREIAPKFQDTPFYP